MARHEEEEKSKMMKKLIIWVAIMLMCYSYMPLASAFMLEPGQRSECEAMILRVTNITGENGELEVWNKGHLEILPGDSVLWEIANTPTDFEIENIGKATVLVEGCGQK